MRQINGNNNGSVSNDDGKLRRTLVHAKPESEPILSSEEARKILFDRVDSLRKGGETRDLPAKGNEEESRLASTLMKAIDFVSKDDDLALQILEALVSSELIERVKVNARKKRDEINTYLTDAHKERHINMTVPELDKILADRHLTEIGLMSPNLKEVSFMSLAISCKDPEVRRLAVEKIEKNMSHYNLHQMKLERLCQIARISKFDDTRLQATDAVAKLWYERPGQLYFDPMIYIARADHCEVALRAVEHMASHNSKFDLLQIRMGEGVKHQEVRKLADKKLKELGEKAFWH